MLDITSATKVVVKIPSVYKAETSPDLPHRNLASSEFFLTATVFLEGQSLCVFFWRFARPSQVKWLVLVLLKAQSSFKGTHK